MNELATKKTTNKLFRAKNVENKESNPQKNKFELVDEKLQSEHIPFAFFYWLILMKTNERPKIGTNLKTAEALLYIPVLVSPFYVSSAFADYSLVSNYTIAAIPKPSSLSVMQAECNICLMYF